MSIRTLNIIAVSFASVAPFAGLLLKTSQGLCNSLYNKGAVNAIDSKVLRLIGEIFDVPTEYILLLLHVQFHAISGVLLYLTTEKYILSRKPYKYEVLSSCGALMVSLFLVHPLRVELVDTRRPGSLLTTLSLCLSLLGLYLASEYLFASKHDESGSYAILICGLASFALTVAAAIDISSLLIPLLFIGALIGTRLKRRLKPRKRWTLIGFMCIPVLLLGCAVGYHARKTTISPIKLVSRDLSAIELSAPLHTSPSECNRASSSAEILQIQKSTRESFNSSSSSGEPTQHWENQPVYGDHSKFIYELALEITSGDDDEVSLSPHAHADQQVETLALHDDSDAQHLHVEHEDAQHLHVEHDDAQHLYVEHDDAQHLHVDHEDKVRDTIDYFLQHEEALSVTEEAEAPVTTLDHQRTAPRKSVFEVLLESSSVASLPTVERIKDSLSTPLVEVLLGAVVVLLRVAKAEAGMLLWSSKNKNNQQEEGEEVLQSSCSQCYSARALNELITTGATIEPCRDQLYEIVVAIAVLTMIIVSTVKSLLRKGYVGPMTFTAIAWIFLVLVTAGYRTLSSDQSQSRASLIHPDDTEGGDQRESEGVCDSGDWLEARIPEYAYLPASFLAYSLAVAFAGAIVAVEQAKIDTEKQNITPHENIILLSETEGEEPEVTDKGDEGRGRARHLQYRKLRIISGAGKLARIALQLLSTAAVLLGLLGHHRLDMKCSSGRIS